MAYNKYAEWKVDLFARSMRIAFVMQHNNGSQAYTGGRNAIAIKKKENRNVKQIIHNVSLA